MVPTHTALHTPQRKKEGKARDGKELRSGRRRRNVKERGCTVSSADEKRGEERRGKEDPS